LSLNIQSIAAKFNELNELINLFESKNCLPDIILLQETWKIVDASLFNLNNYHPLIFKCRSSAQGGGVGIYVKKEYKFQINPNAIFWERIFETIVIDVWINNKLITVGSLYRCINHPTLTAKEQFTEFIKIFNNLLNNLASCELILGGDLNLDALKINSCSFVDSYFDSLYATVMALSNLSLNPLDVPFHPPPVSIIF
jgi:exonuclease III